MYCDLIKCSFISYCSLFGKIWNCPLDNYSSIESTIQRGNRRSINNFYWFPRLPDPLHAIPSRLIVQHMERSDNLTLSITEQLYHLVPILKHEETCYNCTWEYTVEQRGISVSLYGLYGLEHFWGTTPADIFFYMCITIINSQVPWNISKL